VRSQKGGGNGSNSDQLLVPVPAGHHPYTRISLARLVDQIGNQKQHCPLSSNIEKGWMENTLDNPIFRHPANTQVNTEKCTPKRA
tara:strand:- start:18973 stop:19227 length:255 start_codon:yes stop_codon:yes gene_type:complete